MGTSWRRRLKILLLDAFRRFDAFLLPSFFSPPNPGKLKQVKIDCGFFFGSAFFSAMIWISGDSDLRIEKKSFH
jgi:hypothetical protein